MVQQQQQDLRIGVVKLKDRELFFVFFGGTGKLGSSPQNLIAGDIFEYGNSLIWHFT